MALDSTILMMLEFEIISSNVMLPGWSIMKSSMQHLMNLANMLVELESELFSNVVFDVVLI